MIDVLIPFIFGLLVGAGGGVMIAALLVASRDTPPQPRLHITELEEKDES